MHSHYLYQKYFDMLWANRVGQPDAGQVSFHQKISLEHSKNAMNWILNISKKALNGVGKIATGVSSNLLATLIKGYYGIE